MLSSTSNRSKSWEEESQEVFLVDLAHLISWHLLHQQQACGDGVGRHVLPAINTDVNTPKTVYCREEDKHRLSSHTRAQGHTRHWSMCTQRCMYARAHMCNNNNKKKEKERQKKEKKTIAKQRLALWQSSGDKEKKCPSYTLQLSSLISTIRLPDTDNSLRTKQYNHCEMK